MNVQFFNKWWRVMCFLIQSPFRGHINDNNVQRNRHYSEQPSSLRRNDKQPKETNLNYLHDKAK